MLIMLKAFLISEYYSDDTNNYVIVDNNSIISSIIRIRKIVENNNETIFGIQFDIVVRSITVQVGRQAPSIYRKIKM